MRFICGVCSVGVLCILEFRKWRNFLLDTSAAATARFCIDVITFCQLSGVQSRSVQPQATGLGNGKER